jgi:hypothetical protein
VPWPLAAVLTTDIARVRNRGPFSTPIDVAHRGEHAGSLGLAGVPVGDELAMVKPPPLSLCHCHVGPLTPWVLLVADSIRVRVRFKFQILMLSSKFNI